MFSELTALLVNEKWILYVHKMEEAYSNFARRSWYLISNFVYTQEIKIMDYIYRSSLLEIAIIEMEIINKRLSLLGTNIYKTSTFWISLPGNDVAIIMSTKV